MPLELLEEHSTIASLSGRLAGELSPGSTSPTRVPRVSDRIDYRALSDVRSSIFERFLRALIAVVVRITSVVDVGGREDVPESGALLFACNHLHILDALWLATALPRRTIFLVAEEFRHNLLVAPLLNVGRVIYIARGKADHVALGQALDLLGAGGALAVAPEGKLSRTGGLLKGRSGIALLASRSGAPVIPVALSGQERALASWRRFRRVAVHVRFGAPVVIPAGPAAPHELEQYADRIMRALAQILPARYRGVYGAPDDVR